MRRNGARSSTERAMAALSKGLPLIALGKRIPAKLQARGVFWLNRAAQTAQARAFSALGSLGIDPRHFAVMTLLEEAGPLSQREISESLNVDPTMMVALVDELERRELAKRERKKGDRRAHAVRLMPTGARVLREAEKKVDALEKDLFGALSKREYAQLVDLLRRLHPDGCACGCSDAYRETR